MVTETVGVVIVMVVHVMVDLVMVVHVMVVLVMVDLAMVVRVEVAKSLRQLGEEEVVVLRRMIVNRLLARVVTAGKMIVVQLVALTTAKVEAQAGGGIVEMTEIQDHGGVNHNLVEDLKGVHGRLLEKEEEEVVIENESLMVMGVKDGRQLVAVKRIE